MTIKVKSRKEWVQKRVVALMNAVQKHMEQEDDRSFSMEAHPFLNEIIDHLEWLDAMKKIEEARSDVSLYDVNVGRGRREDLLDVITN